jgi:hypothetical protein
MNLVKKYTNSTKKNRKENERENGRKRETAQIPSKVKMEMPSGKNDWLFTHYKPQIWLVPIKR